MSEVMDILKAAVDPVMPGTPVLVVLGIAAAVLLYLYPWFVITLGGSFSCFWCAYTINGAGVSEDSVAPFYMIGFVVIGFIFVCLLFYSLLFKENA